MAFRTCTVCGKEFSLDHVRPDIGDKDLALTYYLRKKGVYYRVIDREYIWYCRAVCSCYHHEKEFAPLDGVVSNEEIDRWVMERVVDDSRADEIEVEDVGPDVQDRNEEE